MVVTSQFDRPPDLGYYFNFNPPLSNQVYLVAHAGPGMEERPNAGSASAAGGGELSPLANSRILHTIRQYSDVIAGQFYGHRHADTFRIIYNEGWLRKECF